MEKNQKFLLSVRIPRPEDQDRTRVLYSAEKNIMLTVINKIGSCSLQNWANSDENSSFVWVFHQDVDSLIDAHNPVMISVLRDPAERLQSALDMLVHQYRTQGLNISWENFTCLEFTIDPHLMPQTCFLLLEQQCRFSEFELDWHNEISAYHGGWKDILDIYDITSRLTKNNKFFLMKSDQNVMQDLANYIDEPALALNWNNRNSEKEWSRQGVDSQLYSEDFLAYVKDVYKSDYQLINHVDFINT